MAKAKKISKIKVKKKLWFKIFSPKSFGEREVGQTYLTSVETAVGRSLKINLKNVTNSIRDQNANVVFLINKSSGGNLMTRTIGYELTSAYVKRMVRKNSNKLDNYFVFKTKNGQEVILKSLLVTLGRAQRSTRTTLSKCLEEFLKKELAKYDFDTFVGELVSRKIQSSAKKSLQKIHPIKEVAVRILKLKDFSQTKSVETVEDVKESEEPKKSEETNVEKTAVADESKEDAEEEKPESSSVENE